MSRNISSELKDLIADYYQRPLSEEEQDRLFKGLDASDELREEFMKVSSEEWMIRNAYHMQHSKTVYMRPRRKRKRIQRIAAGVAVLLSLGGLFASKIISVTISKEPIPVAASKVAEVIDCYVMQGDAISLMNQSESRTLRDNTMLYSGDRILVPSGGRLTFKYLGEDTVIEIGANSLLTLSDENGAKQIRLKSGALSAEVAKQPAGKPMKVITDHAEAVVVGTSFEVLVRYYTQLAVHSGCVRFQTFHDDKSIDVSSGHIADSHEKEIQESEAFELYEFNPVEDKTINRDTDPWFLIVDGDRDYSSLMKFDIGPIQDQIIEAKLLMRVHRNNVDNWGDGIIRLHTVPADTGFKFTPLEASRVQLAYYQGRVDHDMILEMDVNPKYLVNGINGLMLTMDKGGNDVWFCSRKAKFPPQLILKVRPPGADGSP